LHLASNEPDAPEDPAAAVLRLLDGRSLSASYLKQKVPGSASALKSLEKKGFVQAEDVAAERDPLRASAARLRVEFIERAQEKLPKQERELLAYLELHPGQHNVAALEDGPGVSASQAGPPRIGAGFEQRRPAARASPPESPPAGSL
jgi:hypothetical protein